MQHSQTSSESLIVIQFEFGTRREEPKPIYNKKATSNAVIFNLKNGIIQTKCTQVENMQSYALLKRPLVFL